MDSERRNVEKPGREIHAKTLAESLGVKKKLSRNYHHRTHI